LEGFINPQQYKKPNVSRKTQIVDTIGGNDTMAQKIWWSGETENNKKDSADIPLEEVKAEWKMLWKNRIDDKVRAEGIAKRTYELLCVDQGTVISATRDYKPLDLKEILRSYGKQNNEINEPPHPSVGGYGKFARAVLNKQKRYRQWKENPVIKTKKGKKNLQKKKGGKGWLRIQMKK
jgi:hypothetical protein